MKKPADSPPFQRFTVVMQTIIKGRNRQFNANRSGDKTNALI
jgi:hypothetical protein